MTQSQTGYWLGLGASVLVAIAGQAEILPEPWRHIVAILGIVGTAVNGYLLQRPLPDSNVVEFPKKDQ